MLEPTNPMTKEELEIYEKLLVQFDLVDWYERYKKMGSPKFENKEDFLDYIAENGNDDGQSAVALDIYQRLHGELEGHNRMPDKLAYLVGRKAEVNYIKSSPKITIELPNGTKITTKRYHSPHAGGPKTGENKGHPIDITAATAKVNGTVFFTQLQNQAIRSIINCLGGIYHYLGEEEYKRAREILDQALSDHFEGLTD